MENRFEQGRLLKMTIETATKPQQKLIRKAQQIVAKDPWYRTVCFHHGAARLVGYQVLGEIKAIPVY